MKTLVKLHQLSVVRDSEPVLRGVDLVLESHERVAITGPNGAGKTTLLRTMVGLEQATSGDIILFGKHCTHEADFRSHRPKIGFLFQNSEDQLFCPSVAEDVAFGPLNIGATQEQAHHRAMETLQALGITHLASRFTHRLSGGEKRLVCLAGILAMQPEILLLDEPTNGVDTENGLKLRNALAEFHGSIVIVSHDEHFVEEISTRILHLTSGHLIPG
ncbi:MULTISPECIES: energy-coupling factor ABC transporter ATP-binding protein [Dickeya]|uniref:ATPase component NikO of energizing module of nickel ECF transporter n=1 Tax=Dickeya aquatica TaxID=1401087 RepID=A0A375AA05_9GAMM|nr:MULTISPECIES: ABC transporter ATP-binding protein [Dickeya]SLM62761.1 ATPase component NikO of energizing module of nickel ECF transporter [Dickeya aquatica]